MCLVLDRNKTDDFKRTNRRRIKIFKIVKIVGAGLQSPNSTPISSGFYEAKGQPDWYQNQLNGGVIHCYKDIDSALDGANGLKASRRAWNSGKFAILVGWAAVEDFIAIGIDNDIAFKKIYIPKSEIKRILAL